MTSSQEQGSEDENSQQGGYSYEQGKQNKVQVEYVGQYLDNKARGNRGKRKHQEIDSNEFSREGRSKKVNKIGDRQTEQEHKSRRANQSVLGKRSLHQKIDPDEFSRETGSKKVSKVGNQPKDQEDKRGEGNQSILGKRKAAGSNMIGKGAEQEPRGGDSKKAKFKKWRVEKLEELVLWSWNVDGLEAAWEVVKSAIIREQPEVVCIQEHHMLRLGQKSIEGYRAIFVAATLSQSGVGRPRAGILFFVKIVEGRAEWAQEGEPIVVNGICRAVVLVGAIRKGSAHEYVRLVGVYGPQSTKQDEVQEMFEGIQMRILKRIGSQIIERGRTLQRGSHVPWWCVFGDLNVRYRFEQGSNIRLDNDGNETEKPYKDFVSKARGEWVTAEDDEGAKYTFYRYDEDIGDHGTTLNKSMPDRYLVPKDTNTSGSWGRGVIRGATAEIKHDYRVPSKLAHERVELHLKVEGERGAKAVAKKRMVRPVRKLSEQEQVELKVLIDKVADRWQESWGNGKMLMRMIEDRATMNEKQARKMQRQQLTKAHADLELGVRQALDKVRPKVPMGGKSRGRRKIFTGLEKLWSEVIAEDTKENSSGTKKAWKSFEERVNKANEEKSKSGRKWRRKALEAIGKLAKRDKNLVFKIHKKVRGNRREEIPEVMWASVIGEQGEKQWHLVSDRKALSEAWVKQFSRNKERDKGFDQEYKQSVEEELRKYIEKDKKSWHWKRNNEKPWNGPLKRKEFDEEWIEMSNGSVGETLDGITKEVLVCSDKIKEVVFEMLSLMLDVEVVSWYMTRDEVTVIYKKGNKFETVSYRPVSLMSILAKLMQALMIRRVKAARRQVVTKGPSDSQEWTFGNTKGRGRHLMVAILMEAVRSAQFRAKKETGRDALFALVAADVGSAYPNMWREGADCQMRREGVKGKAFNIMRAMEEDMEGVIRVGSMVTPPEKHKWGVNQGSKSAQERWKWFIGRVGRQINTVRNAVTTQTGKKVGAYLYADDVNAIVRLENGRQAKGIQEVVDVMQEDAQKNRYEWAGGKWAVVIFGAKKVGKIKWKRPDGKEQRDVGTTKVLGLKVGGKGFDCKEQFEATLAQGRAATDSLNWMNAHDGYFSPKGLARLVEALVGSVLEGGSVGLTTGESHWDDMDTVRADAIKTHYGLPKQASPRAVLAEMGMKSSRVRDLRGKTTLLRQARQGEAGELVRETLIQREKDMREGETKGLMPVLRKAAVQTGYGNEWNKQDEEWGSKSAFKTDMKEVEKVMEQDGWEDWLEEYGKSNNNLDRTKPKWGTEKYLGWGKKDRLGASLKFAFRIGCANCAGGKVGKRHANSAVGKKLKVCMGCRFCKIMRKSQGKEVPKETEYHLLFECEWWQEERKRMLEVTDKANGGKQWRNSGQSKRSKVANLLTSEGKTRKQGKKADQQVRKFLVLLEKELEKRGKRSLLDDPWANKAKRKKWDEESDWAALEEVASWIENME